MRTTIQRLYLAPNGTEYFPSEPGGGHYSVAEMFLKRAGIPVGNAEECYTAMWRLGCVRVLVLDDRIEAEQFVEGRAMTEQELTPAQLRYFQRLRSAGKSVVLNGQEIADLPGKSDPA